MPIKSSELANSYEKHYQNHSFETLAASWLTADGWEVLVPMIDHGRKTDIVVSDGKKFYRIQVKSLECSNESVVVENKWSNADSTIDYVIYFSIVFLIIGNKVSMAGSAYIEYVFGT